MWRSSRQIFKSSPCKRCSANSSNFSQCREPVPVCAPWHSEAQERFEDQSTCENHQPLQRKISFRDRLEGVHVIIRNKEGSDDSVLATWSLHIASEVFTLQSDRLRTHTRFCSIQEALIESWFKSNKCSPCFIRPLSKRGGEWGGCSSDHLATISKYST